MKKHINIKIYGRVQGVFFRKYTVKKALELSITGFVRNEPDGTVYIEAEGEEENLYKLVEWCHRGPRLANVEKVEVREDEMSGYEELRFRIYSNKNCPAHPA